MEPKSFIQSFYISCNAGRFHTCFFFWFKQLMSAVSCLLHYNFVTICSKYLKPQFIFFIAPVLSIQNDDTIVIHHKKTIKSVPQSYRIMVSQCPSTATRLSLERVPTQTSEIFTCCYTETERGDHDFCLFLDSYILTPTQPVGNGRSELESKPWPSDENSRALPTE